MKAQQGSRVILKDGKYARIIKAGQITVEAKIYRRNDEGGDIVREIPCGQIKKVIRY